MQGRVVFVMMVVCLGKEIGGQRPRNVCAGLEGREPAADEENKVLRVRGLFRGLSVEEFK